MGCRQSNRHLCNVGRSDRAGRVFDPILYTNGEFPDFHNLLCIKYFRWHPEVGKTAAPNLRNIKPQVGVKTFAIPILSFLTNPVNQCRLKQSTGTSVQARGKLIKLFEWFHFIKIATRSNWLNGFTLPNCNSNWFKVSLQIGSNWLRVSLHQITTREVVVFKDAVYSKMVKDLKVIKKLEDKDKDEIESNMVKDLKVINNKRQFKF